VGNTVLFDGDSVWVYGIVGEEAGCVSCDRTTAHCTRGYHTDLARSYEVLVDGSPQGVYNASGGSRV
jgi:hypothetical protein